ncbi:MAG: hypothetical protein E7648_05605 [Ruminococcaceae bacterium]|nr:hypothetical protein [Oscillospiraceae bacterium]
MKKTLCLFFIAVIISSLLCGCSVGNSNTKQYQIKEELIDIYLIDDNVKEKLYSFFNSAEKSYDSFNKNGDLSKFIESVYDDFCVFNEELKATANIQARVEADPETNRHLVSYYIEFTLASEPMLALPLEYLDNPDDIDESDVFSAVNSISQYFCGIDIFSTTD